MIARTLVGKTLACVLAIGLSQVGIPLAQAAPQLVTQSEMAARLLEHAQTREQRVRLFQDALKTPEVEAKARAMGLDPSRLQAAIPQLSDKELADLSQRASKAQDITAGHYRSHREDNSGLVIVGLALLIGGLILLAAVAEGEYDDWDDWDDCGC
jgi:hypothetical protein